MIWKWKKSRVVLVIPGYATLYNNEGSEMSIKSETLKTNQEIHETGGIFMTQGEESWKMAQVGWCGWELSIGGISTLYLFIINPDIQCMVQRRAFAIRINEM